MYKKTHWARIHVYCVFERRNTELVKSYKPHRLVYLTSTHLLFTQNGPWLKQKLEESLETTAREDDNDEERKETEKI